MLDTLNQPFVLTEAAVVERLRQVKGIYLCQHVVHASLIYSQEGRNALKHIYSEYISIAQKAKLPILLAAPTWRTNQERVKNSGVPITINEDAVSFLNSLVKDFDNSIHIGALVGCKNDCYKPEEGLSTKEAIEFHSWQIDKLALSTADYFMAVTLPELNEALGIATVMSHHDKPYFISFVIGADGKLLDGNTLSSAISYIDSNTNLNPTGYFINCSHPSFINKHENYNGRLVGVQANASSRSHAELEKSSNVLIDNIEEWGKDMLLLNKSHGINVLGGCCGTDSRHLEQLTNN